MPKVTIYDTKFCVGRGDLPYSFQREGNPHWENFKALMCFLGSIGFYVSEDKEMKKKFPSLSETNRVGGFDDCDLKRGMHPIFLKLNFIRMYFMKIRMVGFMILINMEKCHI